MIYCICFLFLLFFHGRLLEPGLHIVEAYRALSSTPNTIAAQCFSRDFQDALLFSCPLGRGELITQRSMVPLPNCACRLQIRRASPSDSLTLATPVNDFSLREIAEVLGSSVFLRSCCPLADLVSQHLESRALLGLAAALWPSTALESACLWSLKVVRRDPIFAVRLAD